MGAPFIIAALLFTLGQADSFDRDIPNLLAQSHVPSVSVILSNGENGKKIVPDILHDLGAPRWFADILAITLR